MHTVTSFHASAVPPDRLNAIVADHLALERAHIVRRLLLTRCGMIALVIAIAGGFGWLPPLPCWVGVGLFLLAPASAWVVELRLERRLARRLEESPDTTKHVVWPSSL
jgi:hypothetical protein